MPPLNCLGIWAAANAFAASQTCPSRAVRAPAIGPSESLGAALIARSPALTYRGLIPLRLNLVPLFLLMRFYFAPQSQSSARSIGAHRDLTQPKPVDCFLLRCDQRECIPTLLAANFVKRRFPRLIARQSGRGRACVNRVTSCGGGSRSFARWELSGPLHH